MASYQRSTDVIETYLIGLPTNAAEVQKMLRDAGSYFASTHGRAPADNEIEVTAAAGQLLVTFHGKEGLGAH